MECANHRAAFDRTLNTISFDPSSKGQYATRLRTKHDVLLIDRALQSARLVRSFEMASNHRPVLLEFDDLRRRLTICTLRVYGPVTGNIGWHLLWWQFLGQRNITRDSQQKSDANQK